jgi:hypothetical protein
VVEYLFMFLAEGIAENHPRCRTGARHSLMIFATGPTQDDARVSAIRFASEEGWSFVHVKHGTQIYDDEIIADDMMRDAAEEALGTGYALVTYTNEIPSDG